MDLQLRTQLRVTLDSFIADIMQNNQITPSMLEDALNHALIQVKDLAMTEYAQWAMEDKQSAINSLQSTEDQNIEDHEHTFIIEED